MGLLLLGTFAVTAVDKVPDIKIDQPAGALLMIGNGGSSFWEIFSNSPEYHDDGPDALDRWSRRIGKQLAGNLSGLAIFPFDGPPFHPFQSWAKKTGQVAPSRVSMLMHVQFGLWHAYRFALALPGKPKAPPLAQGFKSPCIDCRDQPCLKACPVEAFAGESFAVDQCVEYLEQNSESGCRTLACEARRSCPVGKEFTYLPQHARFHMDAFVQTRRFGSAAS